MFEERITQVVVSAGLLWACVTPLRAQTRQWTDNTGKFSIEAELAEVKRDHVVLRKANGLTVTVPLARLSDADQEYLKTLAQHGAQPTRDAETRAPLSFPDALTEPPAWNDVRTPFDLAAFLRAPPAEENAAPLYLEALGEFQNEILDITIGPYERLPAAKKVEFERLSHILYERSEKYDQFEEAWQSDPNSVDMAAVDAWLAEYDTGFEKLASAQLRPTCMFQTGRSLFSLLPHYHVARVVARVVEWRTRRDLQRGNLERPLQDLTMQLRLNRDLRVRGPLVAQLVCVALDEQCCELVRSILNASGIDVAHCDRLLAMLVEHESQAVDAFVEGNRADYIAMRQALHDLQHRTGDFDPQTMRDDLDVRGDVTSPLACFEVFFDVGGYRPKEMAKMLARLKEKLLPGAWQGGNMLSDEDYAQEVDALNQFFAAILALTEQPDFRLKGHADVEAAESSISSLNATVFAYLLIPAESPFLDAIRRNEARLRGTQCLVALRRWQLEHAEAPLDFLALAKAAGMSRVPIDPYSGQPLRMGSVAGKTVIYSVGPDGKDDKAQVEWNLAPKQPGDFIFQLETPSQ